MRRWLAILLACGLLSAAAPAQAGRQQDYQALQQLSGEERQVLGRLLSLRLAAAQDQAVQQKDAAQVAKLAAAEQVAQAAQGRDEAAAGQKRHLVGKMLRLVQEEGPGGYLAVLLGASTFNDFVRRLELLQQVFGAEVQSLQGYRQALSSLAADRAHLLQEETAASQAAAAAATAGADYRRQAAAEASLLASLGTSRNSYLADLHFLDQTWYQEADPVLQEFLGQMGGLATQIATGKTGSVSVGLLTGQITVTISAGELDQFVQADPQLTSFSFSVDGGNVDVAGTTPGGPVSIQGSYTVASPTLLQYQVSGVTLDGIPVTGQALRQVGREFSAGLSLDLAGQQVPYQLQGVQESGGQLTIEGN